MSNETAPHDLRKRWGDLGMTVSEKPRYLAAAPHGAKAPS